MINDTQAKHFFAHADTLAPYCFLFTDSTTPEWDQEASTHQDFDFDQMVGLTSKFSLASTDNKRKAFYAPCNKCGDGPVSFENGGKTSQNWCVCE